MPPVAAVSSSRASRRACADLVDPGIDVGHHFVFANGQGALAAAKSVPTVLMARPPGAKRTLRAPAEMRGDALN